MAAGIYNITIEQGATFERIFTVTEPDGDLRNFTGHTGRMQIRRDVDDATVLLELTTENGRIELGGTLGTIRLIVSAADTAALTRGGVYDYEDIDSGGEVDRLLKGTVVLDKEVTR